MKIEFDTDLITRIEVINHAKNEYRTGRLLTLYKMLKDFDSLEFSIQDGGTTLKIFLDSYAKAPEDKDSGN